MNIWLEKGAYQPHNNASGEKHTKCFLFLAVKKTLVYMGLPFWKLWLRSLLKYNQRALIE